PGFRGTLEIVSSDAASLSVKLKEGPAQGWPDLDGDYTVLRCGAAPPVSPPSPAMAVQGAKLPAPPSGPVPDPTSPYLFLGTAPQGCQAPGTPIVSPQPPGVPLSPPAAMQQPGFLTLSAPPTAATYAKSGAPPVACTAFDHITGPLPNGTIEIL